MERKHNDRGWSSWIHSSICIGLLIIGLAICFSQLNLNQGSASSKSKSKFDLSLVSGLDGNDKPKYPIDLLNGMVDQSSLEVDLPGNQTQASRIFIKRYIKTGLVTTTRSAGCSPDLDLARVDTRVLAMLGYLASSFKEAGSTARPLVEVSCLTTGHSMHVAGSGNISAHYYGQAADISILNGVRITGSTQYSSPTMQQAISYLLRLQGRMAPRQLISLLDLSGSSFRMSNHDDHLHVGY